MLAYIGEKIYSWSDPSLVDPKDILDTVALYYLSGSFASSVLIYEQVRLIFLFQFIVLTCLNCKSDGIREELTSVPVKWKVKSKVGYSAFVCVILLS